MTTIASPGPKSTTSGAPLPLVAQPQDDLLSVNIADIPLLKDAFAPGIHFQPLRLDTEHGQSVLMATLAPGCELPIHYHTGTAEVYTLKGRWLYREYPDQPQTAGSYLFEPSGSVHTFITPDTNTEDTVLFLRVEGANINFTEDGQFHSILDALTIQHLVNQLTEARGLDQLNFIRGGEAGFTAQKA